MHAHILTICLLLLFGAACFAAFSWGVKKHFRLTGAMPLGMKIISGLTILGFAWFVLRLPFQGVSLAWPLALLFFVAALAVFFWTVSASRKTPPTLAFDTDEPSFLLHHGPYRHVRHPFYVSYLLFWIGTALASPGILPWAAPVLMLAVYWDAARREEKKFAASGLSASYAQYRARTGMFLPNFSPN